jgi:hypothetical protein
MITKECIESKIETVQLQIKQLTDACPLTPLPAVPMIVNLARGSAEMWQIYQYHQQEHEKLMNLDTEKEFLSRLLDSISDSGLGLAVHERIDLLKRKENACRPMLCQPTTRVKPLSYEEKVSRAKLIAQHIKRGDDEYDAMSNIDKIKQLQTVLMGLEEQYLEL